jgi:hypothetical protein
LSELCKWLHEKLEQLPEVTFPFDAKKLPDNGIYFFYERGEVWGHGGLKQRIVRIGTHRDGNFKSRIAEHFLPDDRKLMFDCDHSAPHDRSIFRKNIGRVLLAREHDDYLKLWEVDFMKKECLAKFSSMRDIEKEKRVEAEITRILRDAFSFRYIVVDRQEHRMGAGGLEKALIGTAARCNLCRPSPGWLGNQSPNQKVRESGLWLSQHLHALPINEHDKTVIEDAVYRSLFAKPT